MDKYIKADDLIHELSEISGELNAQNIGAAIGRVQPANVVSLDEYTALLEKLYALQDELALIKFVCGM